MASTWIDRAIFRQDGDRDAGGQGGADTNGRFGGNSQAAFQRSRLRGEKGRVERWRGGLGFGIFCVGVSPSVSQ